MKTVIIFLISIFVLAPFASALSLDEAKARGVVGEQSDGYLGIRENTPDVRALAADINARRRSEYQNIAQKNNTSVASVEALAGKKAIDITPKGQFIFNSGSWVQK